MNILEFRHSEYLSSDIVINIGTYYIQLWNVSTLYGIVLTKHELYSVIQQIKQYTKPDIEHPFNHPTNSQETLTIKWCLHANNYLSIYKASDRIRLDEISVFTLLKLENILFNV